MTRLVVLPLALMALVFVAFHAGGGQTRAYAIDCSDYPNQMFAQLFLKIDPDDRLGLDGPDDDGIACDDLPCPCDPEPVEEAIGDEGDGATPSPTSTGVSVTAGDVAASASVNIHPLQATGSSAQEQVPGSPTPAVTAVPRSIIVPPSTGNGGLR